MTLRSIFLSVCVVCLLTISLNAGPVGDIGDFLYVRYEDVKNNDESHYVNELDIFYPMRKAYFYDQLDEPELSSNEPRLRLPLRSSMRNGVGAMMDRLLSIRRLPNYPNTTFYRHYKE